MPLPPPELPPEPSAETEPPAEPQTEPENSTEPQTEPSGETLVEPQTEPPAESQTGAPAETDPNGESEEFADEEALREFLVGAWNFYPTEEDQRTTPELGGIPGLSVQLLPDGTFFAILHMSFAQYTGTWELDRLYAGPDELPDWIRFTLDEPDEGLWGFGDYVIQGWARCRGSDRLSLVQVNNGDSVFSTCFDRYDAMLIRGGDVPADETTDPKPDASFCAVVWEVAEDGNALWVTEVDPADFSVGIGSREAVRYALAEDCEIRCPVSAFAPGGLVAAIETNGDGEIAVLNWAEPEMEAFG